MPVKKYKVTLSAEERTQLEAMLQKGKHSTRALNHARILLKADSVNEGGGWTDRQIQEALDVSIATIERVRQRFVEAGLESALKPRQGQLTRLRHRLDGEQEAQLVTLACSSPPEGRARWTLRLLASRLVELEIVDEISYETVRQTLKKTPSSRG